MTSIVSIQGLNKTYQGGTTALKDVDLEIEEGEILALLGPNGAGKTTLIEIVCGMTEKTSGTVTVAGHDNVRAYRRAREVIGIVPQEIFLEPFETVANTVGFTRQLFGKRPDAGYMEDLLRRLSLWDKRDARTKDLSGGMKRRVLIAKALSHDPRVLFLDEPTAGVDVGLRKEMWETVRELKSRGVTIILTTHYIEEAEAMADRIGIIAEGQIKLIEDKAALMRRLGRKRLVVELAEPVDAVPDALAKYDLERTENGHALVYTYDTNAERTGITRLLGDLAGAGLVLSDVRTEESSLEDIFVDLVGEVPA